MTLKKGEPEHRFDFTFAAATRGSRRARRAQRPQHRRTAHRDPRPRPPPPAAPPPAVVETPAAPTVADCQRPHRHPPRFRRSSTRFARKHAEIGGLVEKGDFAAIWVPAFQAKDLALALEPHLAHLLDDARAAAEPALFRLVQGAWRLDAVGDTGNRAEVELAFRLFGEALADVAAAFRTQ